MKNQKNQPAPSQEQTVKEEIPTTPQPAAAQAPANPTQPAETQAEADDVIEQKVARAVDSAIDRLAQTLSGAIAAGMAAGNAAKTKTEEQAEPKKQVHSEPTFLSYIRPGFWD